MSAQESPAAPHRRDEQPSMRELLASCAAANAVSTPPPADEAEQTAPRMPERARDRKGERAPRTERKAA
ncbi:hypothetical protein ACZ90_06480 [Streptomyces albus subsp. albus]|nr:hypothetical protein ACZ90_06480 [Streptomyces albus subsp. albus]